MVTKEPNLDRAVVERHLLNETQQPPFTMNVKKTSTVSSIERPFLDENTVAEMYCNEALIVDNEAIDDWMSSLQSLLTFASIFSAVLITLVVDSKTLLKQDNTDVVVDALVFFMNNLANGTHQPYKPPKFQPSSWSIVINSLFFSSLCFSISTALAAVLALQWVTDYGAVTRRAGSTPEERVRRRHFKYQSGLLWKLDTIIGALPILLHISVFLFFVGLTVWMWNVHRSIFGIVIGCAIISALFYGVTTLLVVFYPSCPYRTPLASWMYAFIRLFLSVVSSLISLVSWGRPGEKERQTKGEDDTKPEPPVWRLFGGLRSRFSQPSLTIRDDHFVLYSNESLTISSLVWLSNTISISPDIYQRLLVLINGFAANLHRPMDPTSRDSVPWTNILRAIGTRYMALLQDSVTNEDILTSFAFQVRCLNNQYLKEIIDSVTRNDQSPTTTSDPNFPLHLLLSWSKSFSPTNSESSIKQRVQDELVLFDLTMPVLFREVEWLRLLREETPLFSIGNFLQELKFIPRDKVQRALEAVLFSVCTGRLPWGPAVQFGTSRDQIEVPSSPLARKLRIIDWVKPLCRHPHRDDILAAISYLGSRYPNTCPLLLKPAANEEVAELIQRGPEGIVEFVAGKGVEDILCEVLITFNDAVHRFENKYKAGELCGTMVLILCNELKGSRISLDKTLLGKSKRERLQVLSNTFFQLIACLTFGIEWKVEWNPKFWNHIQEWPSLWIPITGLCLMQPPFIDATSIWQIRSKIWMYLNPESMSYVSCLEMLFKDINALKGLERGIRSFHGTGEETGDLLLAFLHLNCVYGWNSNLTSYNKMPEPYFALVPDIIVGETTNLRQSGAISQECLDYLSLVSHNLNAHPARVIRLLIELVRADINHSRLYRRPSNLLNILKYARSNLMAKNLRPFSSSCRQLVYYIKESHQQFRDTWSEALYLSNWRRYPTAWDAVRPYYQAVNRQELEMVCEEVVDLLESVEPVEGEDLPLAWPRILLRPTGTYLVPFKEEEMEIQEVETGQEGSIDVAS
ncbi:hypothetical protein FRC18_003439 [Serendipita sp. 400]|nr:hypothetical protein FRC18_003439 [Serendipita sp. 400]